MSPLFICFNVLLNTPLNHVPEIISLLRLGKLV